MTVREFENKCAILSQTPQIRWFDLRFKAFAIMISNSDLRMFDLGALFPITKMLNMIVYCIKVENKYYFFLTMRIGSTTECFNVETIDFSSPYDHILSSKIILSSDDDSDRKTFMPLVMLNNMTKPELKTKLDELFSEQKI